MDPIRTASTSAAQQQRPVRQAQRGQQARPQAQLGGPDRLSLSQAPAAMPSLPGFSAGDELAIRGPLGANGSGQLLKLDNDGLEMQFQVKDPTDTPLLRDVVKSPFTRKDGMLSLALKLERLKDGRVKSVITDRNDPEPGNYVTTGRMVTDSTHGRPRYKVSGPDSSLTIEVMQPGKVRVTLSALPMVGFTVTRK